MKYNSFTLLLGGPSSAMMESIEGCLDGLQNGDIIGWVCNRTQPETIEEVHFVSNLGFRVKARAHLYREDVCRHIGKAGKYGFAISSALLASYGSSFTAVSRLGVPLANGNFTIEPTPVEISPRCSIFLHIQKCAGTSVRAALTEGLRDSETALLYPGVVPGLSMREFNSLPTHQRTQLRLLIGHTYFGAHRFVSKGCDYFTVLRSPLQRIKSLYWHHRSSGNRKLKIGPSSIPLEVLANEGLTEEFDNYQTRIIAGTAEGLVPLKEVDESTVDLALYNIKTYFKYVGLYENLSSDFPKMSKIICGKEKQLPQLNMSNPAATRELDASYRKLDWRKIAYNNRYDIKFYTEIAKMRRLVAQESLGFS